MRHVRTPWRQWLPHGILLALLTVVLAGCGGLETYPQSTLSPKGDFAEKVDALFQTTVWWAVLIFILVEGALLWAIFKFRGKPDDAEPVQTHGNTLVEIVWNQQTTELILQDRGVLPDSTLFPITVHYIQLASQVERPMGKTRLFGTGSIGVAVFFGSG